jgi:hypothetical protein
VSVLCGLAVALTLAACRDEERASPDETYRAYYAKVIEGRTFDEDVEYHARSRCKEVQESLNIRGESSGQQQDMIQTLYLNSTQQVARCGALILSNETIDGDQANLIYTVNYTCAENENTQLFVQMFYEKGWKILSDELKVTGN